MVRKYLQVLAVIALWAVMAAAAQAAGSNFYAPVEWDGIRGTQEVDGEFYNSPNTSAADRVLQSVIRNQGDQIAGIRSDVENLEGEVEFHKDCLNETQLRWLEEDRRQPTIVVVGGQTQSQTMGGASAPQPPPSGGDKNDSKPADEPAKGTRTMTFQDFGGLALIGVLVWIAIVIGQRARNNGNNLTNYQTGMNLFTGAFRGFFAGDDGTSASYVGTLADAGTRPGGLPAAGAGAPAPAAPPPTPSTQQIGAAVASLTGAAPTPYAATGTNLDRMVEAMVQQGMDGGNAADVNALRDYLVARGQIA